MSGSRRVEDPQMLAAQVTGRARVLESLRIAQGECNLYLHVLTDSFVFQQEAFFFQASFVA